MPNLMRRMIETRARIVLIRPYTWVRGDFGMQLVLQQAVIDNIIAKDTRKPPTTIAREELLTPPDRLANGFAVAYRR